jgi:hypothetical protein
MREILPDNFIDKSQVVDFDPTNTNDFRARSGCDRYRIIERLVDWLSRLSE